MLGENADAVRNEYADCVRGTTLSLYNDFDDRQVETKKLKIVRNTRNSSLVDTAVQLGQNAQKALTKFFAIGALRIVISLYPLFHSAVILF